MALSVAVIVANIYYAQPLLADIARAFGLTVSQAGALAMISQAGTACGMLLLVPLGDTLERRTLIAGLTFAAAAALLLTAAAPGPLWFAASIFAVGLLGATVHLVVPYAAQLAPARRRGRVVGAVLSGILFGVLLARTFSGILGAHAGWRGVYAIAALLMLALAALLRARLPAEAPKPRIPYATLLRSIFQLAREHPELREAALLGALFFCAFSAFWTTLVFLLATPPFHYGSQVAGLFGLVGAAGAAGAPWVGRLTDRHGARRAIFASLALALLAFLLLGLAGKSMAGLIAGVLLLDLGVQSGHVANQTRIYALAHDSRSRLNCFYMMCYFIGGGTGSFAGAWAWRAAGWWGVCAFSLAVLTLALAAFALAPRPLPKAMVHA